MDTSPSHSSFCLLVSSFFILSLSLRHSLLLTPSLSFFLSPFLTYSLSLSLSISPVAKWAKADADESIKAGLRTMLQKGQGEALFMATSLGEVDILREFLAKHPQMVDFTAEGRTALHYAAMAGLAESMKVLLEFNSMLERQVGISLLHTGSRVAFLTVVYNFRL